MHTRRSIGMLAFGMLWAVAALCDTPLAKPAPVHVCSRYFCLDSTPGGDTVFRCIKQPDSDRCHWSIPGWHRNLFVSDYGVVAVVQDGGNLLPLDYDRASASPVHNGSSERFALVKSQVFNGDGPHHIMNGASSRDSIRTAESS